MRLNKFFIRLGISEFLRRRPKRGRRLRRAFEKAQANFGISLFRFYSNRSRRLENWLELQHSKGLWQLRFCEFDELRLAWRLGVKDWHSCGSVSKLARSDKCQRRLLRQSPFKARSLEGQIDYGHSGIWEFISIGKRHQQHGRSPSRWNWLFEIQSNLLTNRIRLVQLSMGRFSESSLCLQWHRLGRLRGRQVGSGESELHSWEGSRWRNVLVAGFRRLQ